MKKMIEIITNNMNKLTSHIEDRSNLIVVKKLNPGMYGLQKKKSKPSKTR